MVKSNTPESFISIFGQLNTLGRNGIYCKKTYLYDDIPIHSHNHFEVEVCLNGSSEHWINGSRQKFETGDTVFLSTTDVHKFHILEAPLVLLNIRLDHKKLSSDFGAVLLSVSAPQVGHLTFSRIERFCSVFECLETALTSEDLLSFLDIQGNIFLLFSELLHSFSSAKMQKSNAENSGYVNDAIYYINEHYKEKITLSEIASHINISSNYLSELFTQKTGMCISDYLSQVRVLYAKSLLDNDAMKITDIASEVGFTSYSSFFRTFKKECGVSPNCYKSESKRNRNHILS